MKSLLLFLSAFVPLYVLLEIKILLDIINHNLRFNILNTLSVVFFAACITLGVLGCIFASKSNKKTKGTKITITSKKAITEQYFLGYFSLFVLFALSYELETISMFVVFVLVQIMIYIVYSKNSLFFINPSLAIMGYNFYEITFTEQGSNQTKTKRFLCKGTLPEKEQYTTKKIFSNLFKIE